MSKVIAFANQKGGTGKTTSVLTIASLLSKQQRTVLVIDMDPQASATSMLLALEENTLLDDQTATTALLDGAELPILRVEKHNLDLVPASAMLSRAELELALVPDSIENSRVHRLKKALESIREDYDYVLIDCPGNLGLLTLNGLAACDHILTVSSIGKFERNASRFFVKYVDGLLSEYAPMVKHLGLLLTMTDAYPITDTMLSKLKEIPEVADKVLLNTIPKNNAIRNATEQNESVLFYDIYSPSSKAYMRVLEELEERLARD